jgi:hypothetical protein
MQVQWNFNAQQHEPNQGFGVHPPAQKIPFTISNTAIKETKDKTGGYLSVEFTSPMGVITQNYNINNANPKAVEIAYGQLSALCRAVNIYQIDGMNECAALRGAKGLMDVNYQKGEEPDPAFPDRKGYTELKRVYDTAGNDPSKPAAAQQPQTQAAQPQGAPLTQQPGGGWGAQPQAQQAAPAQPQGQPQPNGPAPGQAWQPGGAGVANTTPPWGNRT